MVVLLQFKTGGQNPSVNFWNDTATTEQTNGSMGSMQNIDNLGENV